SPAGVWLVAYRSNVLEVARQEVMTADIATVGWRRSHSPRLSSEVQVGQSFVDFKGPDGSRRRFAGLVDLTAVMSPQFSPGTVHLRLAHDITTTAEAEVRRDWPLLSGSVKWERLLDVEG